MSASHRERPTSRSATDGAVRLVRPERHAATSCASTSTHLVHVVDQISEPSPESAASSHQPRPSARQSRRFRHDSGSASPHQRRRQSHEPHVTTQHVGATLRRHSQPQEQPARPLRTQHVTVERTATDMPHPRPAPCTHGPQRPLDHVSEPRRHGLDGPSRRAPSDTNHCETPQLYRSMRGIPNIQAGNPSTHVRGQRANSSPEQARSPTSPTVGTCIDPAPDIELSRARRREIIARVNESVQTVMASMLSDTSKSVTWKPKLRKKDISYFTDELTVKPGQTRFCCVTHTHAAVPDIMKLFVVAEQANMQRNNRVLSDSLLEARVLAVLRRPTRERPMHSIYIRYACFQTPVLMTNRTVCLAVATDMKYQPDGSVIGYCLWDSIDEPEFANVSQRSTLPSCTMFRSGFFLRRSGRKASALKDPVSTKVVYMIGLEPGGWAPGFTSRMLMEKFGDNLTRLCSHFRRKQLDARTFVMKAQWVSKLSAKSCHECHKPFQVLSTRVNCHACGHVVCRSCATKEQVELHAVGIVPMHICILCLGKAGLPIPQTTQSTHRRRRLQSETATRSRRTTRLPTQPPPLHHSKSAVESDFIQDRDDDDDTDTGEWAFTSSGRPFQPNSIERKDKA